MRICLLLAFASLALPAVAQPEPPPADHAAAEAVFAQALAAECAKVACRKATRPVTLRMGDGSNFTIATRPLPYFDEKGTLILFAGEGVVLGYAEDDEKLEHPTLAAVIDPLGPVDLPPPQSQRTIGFKLQQMDGKPDMMLAVTNTTKAMVKYDTVAFIPDVVNHNARGSDTPTCALPAPQGEARAALGLEHWEQPLVMVMISNIRALEPGSLTSCVSASATPQ